MGDDVIAGGDFAREEWTAEEFFEGVGDAVQELEDEEGFGVGGGGREEEEVILEDGVEDYWWGEGGEVDDARAGGWLLQVEGEEGGWRWRSICVDVVEDEGAGGNCQDEMEWRGRGVSTYVLVLVKDVEGFYRTHLALSFMSH